MLRDLVGLTASTEFKLIIEANDLGEKPLRSEAEVSVRIEPGDACIFERPSYQFELAEDATVGKVFEKLHARCPKGKPVFTIMSGDNFGQFSCDLNTGMSLKILFEYFIFKFFAVGYRKSFDFFCQFRVFCYIFYCSLPENILSLMPASNSLTQKYIHFIQSRFTSVDTQSFASKGIV